MEIAYTYKVVESNSHDMVIEFSSEGLPTIPVAVPAPEEGEFPSLQAAIEQLQEAYAPIAFWKNFKRSKIVPSVGTSGNALYTDPTTPLTLDQAKKQKLDEIATWRYEREVAGIQVNGQTVQTDRESQAQLSSAFTSLKNGLITEVNWKSTNGSWIKLTLEQIEPIAAAVARHVQDCFTAEKEYAANVVACTTLEEVQQIVVQ